MAAIKCKMCGGDLDITEGLTVCECEYCGSKQTLPRIDSDRKANLYDRANHFRRNNEFDKAEGIYDQVLNEDPSDAEAYWSLVLCRYGIEYVEDPATHRRIPTVNRAQYTSIFADENYKKALEYSDTLQRGVYEAEAKAIDEIQKGILAISSKEEPFDVFICYKETDASGRRTQDSVIANELYHELTKEGFKVFFARITLEDKLGSAYEPYIFAALHSARVMVALGTKPEHFNAVWVKNEWSRYLALIRGGEKKTLIPAYRDMDPYDLPEEFSHLQAQDMSKLGFMPDLIRGIGKVLDAEKQVPATAQPQIVQQVVQQSTGGANLTAQLKRGQQALEDRDWAKADEFFDKALDMDAECAEAFWGKALAAAQCATGEEFTQKRINRKPDAGMAEQLTACECDTQRIEAAVQKYLVPGFLSEQDIRDMFSFDERAYVSLTKAWRERIEEEKSYWDTDRMMSRAVRYAGTELAEKMKAIRDKVEDSLQKGFSESEAADKHTAQETREQYAAHMEQAERKAEDSYKTACTRRKTDQEAAAKGKRLGLIAAAIIAVVAVGVLLTTKVVIPSNNYKSAEELLAAGDYDGAERMFMELDTFKDSAERISEVKLAKAVSLLDSGDYEEAYALLKELGKSDAIVSSKLDRATALLDSGDYEEAYTLLEETGNKEMVVSSKYDRAVALMNSEEYEEAYYLLNGLDYQDSANKVEIIKKALLSKSQIGSTVIFGSYEQDNITTNGKEDIEWLVLDKKGNRILVISLYALDCSGSISYESGDSRWQHTWETCSLREFLNGTFIDSSFNPDERDMIPSVIVTADNNPNYNTNPGNNTTDKVFILSASEAKRYFASDMDRQCRSTDYAIAKGCYILGDSGNCYWWLRTPGQYRSDLTRVSSTGAISLAGQSHNFENDAIRPALWINLE